jgi:hypothetical protein
MDLSDSRQMQRKVAQLLLFDHFEVDGDVHVVADYRAAAVHRGVPLHTEILAIDFGGSADGDP